MDVLQEYFLSGKLRMSQEQLTDLLSNKYKVAEENFYVMTCHRRENVENKDSLIRILELASSVDRKVVFPAGYRTQKQLKLFGLKIPNNVTLVDPIGYLELLELIVASKGVLTDSGTIVEETAVLGIPAVQMRKATERPQVYEFGSAVKFDPSSNSSIVDTVKALDKLKAHSWKHGFGDGEASYRIVDDLIERFNSNTFNGHQPTKYEPHSLLSFRS